MRDAIVTITLLAAKFEAAKVARQAKPADDDSHVF